MDEVNLKLEKLSLRNLKEEMQKILSDQSKLNEEMQKNLSDQSKMNERIQSIFKHIQRNGLFNNSYFPLGNNDDLNYMEHEISKEMATDPKFRSLLVKDLVFIGGKDVKDMVIRLMTKLFTMELLSGYSLAGYKDKSLPFSGLIQINKVIFDAVTTTFKNTTKEDINKAITDHLNYVKVTVKERLKSPKRPVRSEANI